jgi:DNA-binding helix-hairpin-helix protein with protein kinase domain
MFNYSEKTFVGMEFKKNDLLKMLKADKKIKSEFSSVESVRLTNIISPERTLLEASRQVKEIYVIEIVLNSKSIPMLFVDAFNKYIEFQTLLVLRFKNEVKYISSLKLFTEDKMKVMKTFESEWQKEEKVEFPITNKLKNVFKEMISKITNIHFLEEENFQEYVSRFETIKKLKQEIEKQTKLMHAEKQPNLRMALNDKIKTMKKELKEKING